MSTNVGTGSVDVNDGTRRAGGKFGRVGTHVDFASAVLLFGIAKGVPPTVLEEATGLSLATLVDPSTRVPDSAIGAAWRVIGEHFPGEPVGVQMARAAPLSVFGALCQATRYCPTGFDVLEVFARYCRVVSGGADMRVELLRDEVVMHLRHSQDEVDEGHGAEAGACLGVRVGRELHGITDVERVEFRYPLHAPIGVYEDFFQAEIRADTGRNALVFSRETLDCAPQQPDPTMYGYVQDHLDRVRKQLIAQVRDSPLDRVRHAAAEQGEQGRFRVEHVAKALGMSVRSLQRHALEHGETIRAVIDEVRLAQSTHLLGDERLSVEEVAFLVGYADDRAFRRAYKRWTGLTPAAYRASL